MVDYPSDEEMKRHVKTQVHGEYHTHDIGDVDWLPKIPIGYLVEWSDPDDVPDGWVFDEEQTKQHQSRPVPLPNQHLLQREDGIKTPLTYYPTTVIIRKVSD